MRINPWNLRLNHTRWQTLQPPFWFPLMRIWAPDIRMTVGGISGERDDLGEVKIPVIALDAQHKALPFLRGDGIHFGAVLQDSRPGERYNIVCQCVTTQPRNNWMHAQRLLQVAVSVRSIAGLQHVR